MAALTPDYRPHPRRLPVGNAGRGEDPGECTRECIQLVDHPMPRPAELETGLAHLSSEAVYNDGIDIKNQDRISGRMRQCHPGVFA